MKGTENTDPVKIILLISEALLSDLSNKTWNLKIMYLQHVYIEVHNVHVFLNDAFNRLDYEYITINGTKH
jgi:hypothetical protein